ncbi:unnamed protein product [Mycena citricolor]|uniref:INO80 complex subunit B-like conserved region domain-containing protein n=1 Tax=Mycena citricolor TaxID=2018698 RepID=A0AAD2K8A8_9AGAR|nr:unnamed protein product [Mycena citricolor]
MQSSRTTRSSARIANASSASARLVKAREPEDGDDQEQVEVDVLPEAASTSQSGDDEEREEEDPDSGEPEVDEPEEYELEDEEDDELQQSRSPSISVTPVRSPLKIKFKVRPPPALARAKRLRALTQVQSESETSESEEETLQNSRLTKRQAALARARHNGGSSQSSGAEEDGEEDQIDPSSQNKRKTVLDATEIALRKEESARKRRNVTEKKLQDEKAETINRLLKKSARPRGKRGPAMGTALPTPVEAATPMLNSDGEAEGGEDPMFAVAEDIYTPPPMMYRWVSTTRPPAPSDAAAMEVDGDEKHMSLSFAIPGDFLAGLDHQPGTEGAISAAPSALAPICGVSGCGLTRKYRLVGGEWGSGACGMDHLKLLQAH